MPALWPPKANRARENGSASASGRNDQVRQGATLTACCRIWKDAPMANSSSTQDVHLLLLDTLSDWEAGFAIAHINRPAPGVSSRYRVRGVGLNRSPVR